MTKVKEFFEHFFHHSHTEEAGFFDEVILHGLFETLKIIPFLLIAYIIMEFIEHKASDKVKAFLTRSGSLGPLVGGALGAIPQCAFSAVASNLYAGRIITFGTLIAVFLSTSDEMLPLLIGSGTKPTRIIVIIGYKLIVGIAVGFLINLYLRMTKGKRRPINVEDICEEEGCHCEKGIFISALIHTAKISGLILAVTLAVNCAVYFIGADTLGAILGKLPGISHLASAFIGLVPGCATSVALTSLAISGVISDGVMLSGLFSGAGIGLFVLLKVNKSWRENLMIMAILVGTGFVFGLLYDLLGIGGWFI